MAFIAGGQRVGGDAVVRDAGKALLKVGAVHRVVQTPPGLGSVDQQIPGHLKAPFVSVDVTLCLSVAVDKLRGGRPMSGRRRLPGEPGSGRTWRMRGGYARGQRRTPAVRSG